MTTSIELEKIEEFVKDFIAESKDLFLVDIKIAPGNKVIVLLDGDEGVTIDNCTAINKALYKFIEENAVFGDSNFSLEVSSPGLDEPLKLFRQYKKNVGRFVDITLNDGSKKEGKLIGATEDGVVIETETGKGKKKETKQESVLFDQIKNTKIQVKF